MASSAEFICVVCGIGSSFSWYCEKFHCINNQLIHLSVGEYLGCFKFGVAMDSGGHKQSFLLGIYPGVELVGVYLALADSAKQIFQGGRTVSHSHSQGLGIPIAIWACHYVVFVGPWIAALLLGRGVGRVDS